MSNKDKEKAKGIEITTDLETKEKEKQEEVVKEEAYKQETAKNNAIQAKNNALRGDLDKSPFERREAAVKPNASAFVLDAGVVSKFNRFLQLHKEAKNPTTQSEAEKFLYDLFCDILNSTDMVSFRARWTTLLELFEANATTITHYNLFRGGKGWARLGTNEDYSNFIHLGRIALKSASKDVRFEYVRKFVNKPRILQDLRTVGPNAENYFVSYYGLQ